MASTLSNVFSSEELNYLNNLPEVLAAKSRLSTANQVYFKIPLTQEIRETIQQKLCICITTEEIPMRWIKGDTAPHVDVGANTFERTYLVYMNDSAGEFILGDDSYPITANSAFIFNEGISHKTCNTGSEPRLLIGPMSEFAEQVGEAPLISYYSNYADASAMTNSIAVANSYIVGSSIFTGSIGSYTSWRIAYMDRAVDPESNLPGVYNTDADLEPLLNGMNGSFHLYPAAPCFLEGTKILCLVDGVEKTLPVESLKAGDLVKTSRDGYKPLVLIGKGLMRNPGTDERTENRLYKCSRDEYPELNEDLFITGCHSILVDHLTTEQREKTEKQLGKIFVTDKKYRLMACIDERAEPWNSEGEYTIWHFALDNAEEKYNYGVYANGLLVETCSIFFLKNKSNMTLL